MYYLSKYAHSLSLSLYLNLYLYPEFFIMKANAVPCQSIHKTTHQAKQAPPSSHIITSINSIPFSQKHHPTHFKVTLIAHRPNQPTSE